MSKSLRVLQESAMNQLLPCANKKITKWLEMNDLRGSEERICSLGLTTLDDVKMLSPENLACKCEHAAVNLSPEDQKQILEAAENTDLDAEDRKRRYSLLDDVSKDPVVPMSEEEARLIFELYDADDSGNINPNELVLLIKAFRRKDSLDRAAVLKVWDTDKSGEVGTL